MGLDNPPHLVSQKFVFWLKFMGDKRMKRCKFLLFTLIFFICIIAIIYVPKWQLLGEDIKDPKTLIELETMFAALNT